jgi:PQQ-dependent catabolism-associated CXXCW motif protein
MRIFAMRSRANERGYFIALFPRESRGRYDRPQEDSMFRYLFVLLAAVGLQAGFVPPAFAQAQARSQAGLLAPYLVTIEGESRQRTLRLTRTTETTKDDFGVEGTYGMIDGAQEPATARVTQSAKARTLKITTPGQSFITVTQTGEGVFIGRIKFRSGNDKAARLDRVSEADLRSKVLAAIAAREGQEFAAESKDWGIAPTQSQRLSDHHAPTPLSVKGAKLVKTIALRKLLATDPNVVVVDLLDGEGRMTVPGAHWMAGAGLGLTSPAEVSWFTQALQKLTGGNKARPVVFLCLSSECWLSYNASLLAVEAGWRNVMWYRGGVDAWTEAGFPTQPPERMNW